MQLSLSHSRPTQATKILLALDKAGKQGMTTNDFLSMYISRFSARLLELRKQGHNIKSEPMRRGQYRYTLIKEEK